MLDIERFRLKIPPQPKYHLLAVIKREHFALIVKSRRRHHLAQRDGAVLASEQCSDGSKALFLLVPSEQLCLRGGFFLVSRCGEDISHRLLKEGFVLLVVFRVLMVDLDEFLAPVASKWSKRNKPSLFKQFPHPRFRHFDTTPLPHQCAEDATLTF